MTRDKVREGLALAGIKCDSITDDELRKLRKIIIKHLRKSGIYGPGSGLAQKNEQSLRLNVSPFPITLQSGHNPWGRIVLTSFYRRGSNWRRQKTSMTGRRSIPVDWWMHRPDLPYGPYDLLRRGTGYCGVNASRSRIWGYVLGASLIDAMHVPVRGTGVDWSIVFRDIGNYRRCI